jgi:ankyrin repeat protein
MRLHELYATGITPSAFNVVARYGDVDMLKWMRGLDPGTLDFSGAMDNAASHGKLEALVWLQSIKPQSVCTSQGICGAATSGHIEVLRWLFENCSVLYHSSAVAAAAQHGHWEVVQAFLEVGPQPVSPVEELRAAIEGGEVKCVRMMLQTAERSGTLQRALEPEGFEIRRQPCDEVVRTMLYLAVTLGRTEIVELLLEFGAKPDTCAIRSCDSAWITPLMRASRIGNLKIVEALLAGGANPKLGTPVVSAVMSRNIQIVQALVLAGANVDEKPLQAASSALKRACQAGLTEIVQILLQSGAKKDKALTGACVSGKIELVQLLLDHGCDIEENSSAPIRAACENDHIPCVNLLLSYGATFPTMAFDAYLLTSSPGIVTFKTKPEEFRQLLLAYLRDNPITLQPSIPSQLSPEKYEEFVLRAMRNGRPDQIEVLLDQAPANLLNKLSRPAKTCVQLIHVAACKGWLNVLRKIVTPDNVDVPKGGTTPLAAALSSSHVNMAVVQLLLERGAEWSVVTPGTAQSPVFCALKHPLRTSLHLLALFVMHAQAIRRRNFDHDISFRQTEVLSAVCEILSYARQCAEESVITHASTNVPGHASVVPSTASQRLSSEQYARVVKNPDALYNIAVKVQQIVCTLYDVSLPLEQLSGNLRTCKWRDHQLIHIPY